MDDQVPFKVYAFLNSGLQKPEVRRFGIDKSVVSSFHYLNAKLQEVYSSLKTKPYYVCWKDEDGDEITISSDDEIMIALGQMREDLVKLYVFWKDNAHDAPDAAEVPIFMAFGDVGSPPGAVPPPQLAHFGVVCDACDGEVVGFRYKCVSCSDFDLCARCEGAKEHAHHCMIRLPAPQLPHEVLKATVKRARQFMKSVPVKEECPFKKHRRDRSADKKHHHEDGHKQDGHHKHGRHGRRTRISWLDTFATYMNEFADLAGDVGCQQPKNEPKETSQASQTSGEKGDGATQTPTAPNATPQPGPSALNLEHILKPENVKYLLDIQKTLTDILVPNLAPEKSDVGMGSGDGKVPEMNKGDAEERRSMESDTSNVSVASSASNNSKFVDVNDKAEGWTVINNDLTDVASPSAPAPAPGFNLPREFQRVTISDQPIPSIYPPLNTATAVLDPQASEQPAQPQPQATQPQPQPQPQPQQPTQPQAPQKRHPKAHIAAAIDNMLAMGFNNDGDWLTQLLEKYDGNIASVLDLLSPVSPKRK